eukprot:Hpha_TRINITY_DN16661_c2_g2::TRINITY_DN16661_c2_g2_i1::g.180493::m.180493
MGAGAGKDAGGGKPPPGGGSQGSHADPSQRGATPPKDKPRNRASLQKGETALASASAAVKMKRKALPPVAPSAYLASWRRAQKMMHTAHDPTFSLHYALVCMVTPEEHARSWNAEFQQLLQRQCYTPQELAGRRDDLRALVSAFTEEALDVSRTIVEELSAEDEARTIPDIGLGGSASYRHNGVMYRVWSDPSQARHLHNSLGAVVAARVPTITAPLSSTIRYRGRSVTAMACVQLSKPSDGGLQTRVYPPPDPDTPHGPAVDCALRRLCEVLNLEPSKELPLRHVEVHSAADGRLYIFDPRRILPALEPAKGYAGGLLRRESLHEAAMPVNPAPWVPKTGEQVPPACVEVDRMLNQKVPAAVDNWLREGPVSGARAGEELCAALHRRGVNLRYMGEAVRELHNKGAPPEAIRTAVEEVVARCCRSLLMAELASSKSSAIDVGLISASRLFGAAMQDHNDFWAQVLGPVAESKFRYTDGLPPLALENVDQQALFRRMCTLCGVVMRQGSVVDLLPRLKEPHELETLSEELLMLGRDAAALHHQSILTGISAKAEYGLMLVQLNRDEMAKLALEEAKLMAEAKFGKQSTAAAWICELQAGAAGTAKDADSAISHSEDAVARLRELSGAPGAGAVEHALLGDAMVAAARAWAGHGDEEGVGKCADFAELAEEEYRMAGLSESVAFERLQAPLIVRAAALSTIQPGPEAEGCWHAIVDARTRHYGPTHPDVAAALTELGDVQDAQGMFAESAASHQSALQITVTARGARHKQTSYALQALSSLYFKWHQHEGQGEDSRLDLSLELLAEAVALQRGYAVKDPENEREELANMLASLSNVHVKKGDLAKADANLVEGISMMGSITGENSTDTIRMKKALARIRFRRRTAAAIDIQRTTRGHLVRRRQQKKNEMDKKHREEREALEREERDTRREEESAETAAREEVRRAKEEDELSRLDGDEREKAEAEMKRRRELEEAMRGVEESETAARTDAADEETRTRGALLDSQKAGELDAEKEAAERRAREEAERMAQEEKERKAKEAAEKEAAERKEREAEDRRALESTEEEQRKGEDGEEAAVRDALQRERDAGAQQAGGERVSEDEEAARGDCTAEEQAARSALEASCTAERPAQVDASAQDRAAPEEPTDAEKTPVEDKAGVEDKVAGDETTAADAAEKAAADEKAEAEAKEKAAAELAAVESEEDTARGQVSAEEAAEHGAAEKDASTSQAAAAAAAAAAQGLSEQQARGALEDTETDARAKVTAEESTASSEATAAAANSHEEASKAAAEREAAEAKAQQDKEAADAQAAEAEREKEAKAARE